MFAKDVKDDNHNSHYLEHTARSTNWRISQTALTNDYGLLIIIC